MKLKLKLETIKSIAKKIYDQNIHIFERKNTALLASEQTEIRAKPLNK